MSALRVAPSRSCPAFKIRRQVSCMVRRAHESHAACRRSAAVSRRRRYAMAARTVKTTAAASF